jgi:enamine deaminase RidA (YjgF/YER057c/UK114 family)
MSDNKTVVLQPSGWNAPQGYANGIVAEGRFIVIAGQIGWTAKSELIGDGFVAQVEQALKNIVQILAEAGAKPHHLVRLNWYVTDKHAYLGKRREIGEVYRSVIGKHYPAMTLVVVAGLLEPRAKVEIEATAVLPS